MRGVFINKKLDYFNLTLLRSLRILDLANELFLALRN